MEAKTTRQVKVCGKYHHRSGHGRDLPWLTVSGLWLENAGFRIGDQLRINVENNKLIITNQHYADQSH